MDARVADPLVTGTPAAALGALKSVLRGGKYQLPPLTRDYLLTYARDARTKKPKTNVSSSTPPASPDGTEEVPAPAVSPTEYPRFDRLYTAGLNRIRRTPSAVFVGSEFPRRDKVKQGQIGDCYFLAVVGAMLNQDASAVRHMVTVKDDGSCDVRFPSGRVAKVARLSDAEIALASGSTGTGRWVAVLENAFGQARNDLRPDEDQKEVATDLIAKGGSPRAVIRLLTGHDVRLLLLRSRASKALAPVESVAAKLPTVREALTTTLNAKRLCAASTLSTLDLPPAINGKHAYTVVSYDAARDTVRIWNPHGNIFTPKGSAGLVNGYETQAGEFEMPLAEFVVTFNALTYETDKLYMPPTPKSGSKIVPTPGVK